MSSRCRSCGAPVVWAVSERGKRMILDAAPYTGDDPRGLFVLRTGGEPARAPVAMATTPDAFPGEPVYVVHQSTCPDRESWRRP